MRKNHQLSFVLVGVLLLLSLSGIAQDSKIDSLKAIVESGRKDSVVVSTMNALSLAYMYEGEFSEAFDQAERSSQLASEINYLKGKAIAQKYMGNANFYMGNFEEVLTYWNQSLETFTSLDDDYGIAEINNNIGAAYYQLGLHEKALEYYLVSLDVSEKIKDTFNISKAKGNIGGLYVEMRNYDQAMNFFKDLELDPKLKDDQRIYRQYLVGMAEVYFEQGKYDEAYKMLEPTLELSGPNNLADVFIKMGRVEHKRGNIENAINYMSQAYETAKEYEQQLSEVQSLIALANVYMDYNYQEAINTFKEAEEIAKEMEINDELRDIYEGMSKTYAAMGDFDNAFEYQELYIAQKDLVFNLDTDNKIRNLQFDFDLQKKQDEIDLLEKEAEIQDLQEKRQKTVTWAVSILLFFIGLLALSQYRRYRFTMATNKVIQEEKDRSDKLLLNILPEETAAELKENGKVGAQRIEKVTVLFTDFVGFTKSSEDLEPEELVSSVDHYFSHFDNIVDKYGLEKIKTIGDSYMCAGGLPHPDEKHVVKIILAAMEMRTFVEETQKEAEYMGLPFEVRIGLNTGTVVAGVVGTKKFAYDIWGDTVNTASRMESGSKPGKINVSQSTYDEVKDYFDFEYRGEKQVKGKQKVKMYFLTGIKDQELIDQLLAAAPEEAKIAV